MFTAQEFVLKQLLSVAFVKLAFQTYLSACVENNQYDMHIAHWTFTSKQYAFAHCGIKSNQWTFGMTNEIAIKICHHNIFLPKFDCERICRYKLSILSFDWSHTFIPCSYSFNGIRILLLYFFKKSLVQLLPLSSQNDKNKPNKEFQIYAHMSSEHAHTYRHWQWCDIKRICGEFFKWIQKIFSLHFEFDDWNLG